MEHENIDRARKSNLWIREPDNWYVEPEWVSRRLFEAEPFDGFTVDPCCGLGNIVKSGVSLGKNILGIDLRRRAGMPRAAGGHDFFNDRTLEGIYPCDNIVSNPPYGRATSAATGNLKRVEERFLELALKRAANKVALFLDANWMNSARRGRWLETMPLYRVYYVGPRPACPPGHLVLAGEKIGAGRTDYAWYVFMHGFSGHPTIHWLRRDP